MNRTEARAVAKAIQDLIPDLYAKNRLLAATPRGSVLRGIHLENSSDPRTIYVWAFVQPLYVPASTMSLSLGIRLGGPSRRWAFDDPDPIAEAVKQEGVPFFQPISSPGTLAAWPFVQQQPGPYPLQARAYSLVASARFDDAVRVLRELVASLGDEIPWMRQMRERADRLAGLCERAPNEALEQLRNWEAETVDALRIADIP